MHVEITRHAAMGRGHHAGILLTTLVTSGTFRLRATVRRKKGGEGHGVQPGHFTPYSGHRQGGLVDAAITRRGQAQRHSSCWKGWRWWLEGDRAKFLLDFGARNPMMLSK